MRPAGHFRYWDGQKWAAYRDNWMQKLVTRVFESDVQTERARKEIHGHLSIHLGIERNGFDANGHLLFLQDCVLNPVTLVARRMFSEEVCKREPRVAKKRDGTGVLLHGIRCRDGAASKLPLTK